MCLRVSKNEPAPVSVFPGRYGLNIGDRTCIAETINAIKSKLKKVHARAGLIICDGLPATNPPSKSKKNRLIMATTNHGVINEIYFCAGGTITKRMEIKKLIKTCKNSFPPKSFVFARIAYIIIKESKKTATGII